MSSFDTKGQTAIFRLPHKIKVTIVNAVIKKRKHLNYLILKC